MKNPHTKLKSVLIALSISNTTSFKDDFDDIESHKIFINNFKNYLGLDFIAISDEILNEVLGKMKEKEQEVIPDFVVLEKHGNKFVVVWYSKGEHFVHVYSKHSNHKGTRLYSVCEDITEGNKYTGKDREFIPEEMTFVWGYDLATSLDFDYAINHPDIALVSILLGQNYEKAQSFINREIPDACEYCIQEEEDSFFKEHPELKRYAVQQKSNWELSNFNIKVNEE